ncbi:hypothetical protein TSUD_320280 [Trifolium subterraneum]|uniref:FAS1 domain-containing protein n=1 Tax=Trifolium subterraneum TaxID=3900 RepID=A0A2Z6N3Q3_TRISU|nr:hypothetical protein TSUD_320280 [Trifolium subterraneum]
MMKLILQIIIIFILSSSTSSLNLSSPVTSTTPSPPSSFLNLTEILRSSHFFRAASEFQSHLIDREIDTRKPTTLLIPDDKAFANASVRYNSLSDDDKYFVLTCHVVSEYLPPAVLNDTARGWHLEDTLATAIMGQNKYKLNISSMANGSVVVSTTNVQALVTHTLYDRQQIAIYAISKVLMPVELPHPTPVSSDASGNADLSFLFFLLVVIWI